MSKIVGWLIVIFLAFYLFTNPDGAAHFVTGAFNGLHSAANSLARFVNNL